MKLVRIRQCLFQKNSDGVGSPLLLLDPRLVYKKDTAELLDHVAHCVNACHGMKRADKLRALVEACHELHICKDADKSELVKLVVKAFRAIGVKL